MPIAASLVTGGVQGRLWPTDSIAGTIGGGVAVSIAVRVLTPPAPADHR